MTVDEVEAKKAELLISLDDEECESPGLVGNKAATLSKLRRAGFEVPPGLVVPAPALAEVGEELPASVASALMTLPGRLGGGPWAVRSSSTSEDTELASYAGQFDSFLNVMPEGLAEAVFGCWRSQFSSRVNAYQADRPDGRMAVLVQGMVNAEAAGVAFTVDPVSGRRQTLIEAVAGLGERLVSGASTPERWSIDPEGSISGPAQATVLDEAKVRAIADLAHGVETHLGGFQDLEWAIEDGTLYLVQARPITSLPGENVGQIPIAIEAPPGFWTRDSFHEPVPITPFGWVLLSRQVLEVLPKAFAEFGAMIDRGEAVSIGGWVYNRTVPLGAPPPARKRDGRAPKSAPPRWILRALFRLHPRIRRRVAAARRAVATDLAMRVIRRWAVEWRPEHQRDVRRALKLDLGGLSDEQLVAELDHRLEVVAHPAHAMVGFGWWLILYDLFVACDELLEWDAGRMLTLLEGLSTTSTQPGRHLARIAQLARSDPGVIELLEAIDEETPSLLGQVSPRFAEAFAGYVEETGHRAVRYDVIDPTLAETPHLLLRLVASHMKEGISPDQWDEETRQRRTRATAEARLLLAERSEADRARFERSLTRAAEAYPAWEDRVWWTQSVQTALLRYLGLEIGRRLASRGQVSAPEDVFFLEALDARAALLDGCDRHHTAQTAKGRRAWAMAHPGPPTFGEPPSGEPPFDLLPPPARFVNRAILWGISQFFGSAKSSDQGTLSGVPASAGRYSGPVRVITGEHEFDRIQPGDVVVCPTTSPAWSIVFPSMGALVTDSGGILSHPAIIAREHGIPAVVDTGNATRVLKDGQQVTVDGSTGLIEPL